MAFLSPAKIAPNFILSQENRVKMQKFVFDSPVRQILAQNDVI